MLDRLPWALPADAVYELSETAVDLLRRQFAAYDEDADGLLTWHQLDRMYRCGCAGWYRMGGDSWPVVWWWSCFSSQGTTRVHEA